MSVELSAEIPFSSKKFNPFLVKHNISLFFSVAQPGEPYSEIETTTIAEANGETPKALHCH